jgi:hypothetical protein
LREKGYKESYLQQPNLDPTKKNREAITRILKSPLNELWSIWHLDTLLSPEELMKLKKSNNNTTCGGSVLGKTINM